MKKKIETSEERLKQDEYGLYINAPNYDDQRARMENGIRWNNKMLAIEKRNNKYLAVFLIRLVLVVAFLIIFIVH